jgi:hypothetical protein
MGWIGGWNCNPATIDQWRRPLGNSTLLVGGAAPLANDGIAGWTGTEPNHQIGGLDWLTTKTTNHAEPYLSPQLLHASFINCVVRVDDDAVALRALERHESTVYFKSHELSVACGRVTVPAPVPNEAFKEVAIADFDMIFLTRQDLSRPILRMNQNLTRPPARLTAQDAPRLTQPTKLSVSL